LSISVTWWTPRVYLFGLQNLTKTVGTPPHPHNHISGAIVTTRVQFVRLTCYIHFRFASHCVRHIVVNASDISPPKNGNLDFKCSTQSHQIFYCKMENVGQIGILNSFNCPVSWPQCKKKKENHKLVGETWNGMDLGVCFYMHQ